MTKKDSQVIVKRFKTRLVTRGFKREKIDFQ